MPIHPLPQFEADLKVHLAEEDRKAYEALRAPKTMVVRFGAMKLVGEFPYSGSVKPGCGSKIVVRTFRGTELGEMLTSTCPNSGCSKSVSRRDMLGYIQNSGGRDYPFFTEGRVLRVAEVDDLNAQQRLEQSKHDLRLRAKAVAERLGQPIKIVEAEPILGGETLTFYYLSEERLDVRDLTAELGHEFRTHVEVRPVGARDEARLTADYERCGQYCCCKNFLKVLKPVSMKSAKVQKATLDPLKISGRCGRLMCCLRYEDQTYEELRKNLPRKKSRVGTPDGDGTVLDGQILTQLVLVRLDAPGADGKFQDIAVPVENLIPPSNKQPPRLDGPPVGAGHPHDSRRAQRPLPRHSVVPKPDSPAAPATGGGHSEVAARPPRAPRDERRERPQSRPDAHGERQGKDQRRPSQRGPQGARSSQSNPERRDTGRPPLTGGTRPPHPGGTDNSPIGRADIPMRPQDHDNPSRADDHTGGAPPGGQARPHDSRSGDGHHAKRRRRRRGGGSGGSQRPGGPPTGG